jgi:hypothetical protein
MPHKKQLKKSDYYNDKSNDDDDSNEDSDSNEDNESNETTRYWIYPMLEEEWTELQKKMQIIKNLNKNNIKKNDIIFIYLKSKKILPDDKTLFGFIASIQVDTQDNNINENKINISIVYNILKNDTIGHNTIKSFNNKYIKNTRITELIYGGKDLLKNLALIDKGNKLKNKKIEGKIPICVSICKKFEFKLEDGVKNINNLFTHISNCTKCDICDNNCIQFPWQLYISEKSRKKINMYLKIISKKNNDLDKIIDNYYELNAYEEIKYKDISYLKLYYVKYDHAIYSKTIFITWNIKV